jgi:HSP20 family protein
MTEVKEAPKPKTTNGQGQKKDIAPQAPTVPQKAMGNPFVFMRRFAEEMDRLFEDFGLEAGWHFPRFLTRGHELLRRETGLIPAEWSPKVDVFEREGQFVVHADLPGLSKEDVKVELTKDLLTIEGERKQEKKEERGGYCYSERSFGTFYRTIPLPEGVDATKATADFHKGVLEVTMPMSPRAEPKARRLEVREVK